ncbi:hypothetical protein C8F01DRAFT_1372305 [Mycena amicta]|nr:hypothetical protein C8F01DRAFT_1372305 [Mycena amicta]
MSQIKIPHDDRRIEYSQLWTAVPGPMGAEHTTAKDGESFRFSFNVSEGSTIEVHGGLRPTVNASLVPVSSYTLDSDSADYNYTAPWISNGTAPLVKFFESSALGAGAHTLLVYMLSNNSYYLDFIQINDASVDPAGLSRHRGKFTSGEGRKRPFPAAGIAGIVFGSIVLLLGVIAAMLLCFRRRRTRARRKLTFSFVEPARERKGTLDTNASVLTPYTLTAPSPTLQRQTTREQQRRIFESGPVIPTLPTVEPASQAGPSRSRYPILRLHSVPGEPG